MGKRIDRFPVPVDYSYKRVSPQSASEEGGSQDCICDHQQFRLDVHRVPVHVVLHRICEPNVGAIPDESDSVEAGVTAYLGKCVKQLVITSDVRLAGDVGSSYRRLILNPMAHRQCYIGELNSRSFIPSILDKSPCTEVPRNLLYQNYLEVSGLLKFVDPLLSNKRVE